MRNLASCGIAHSLIIEKKFENKTDFNNSWNFNYGFRTFFIIINYIVFWKRAR